MLEQIRQYLRFSQDEEGATAVEYGIMVAAIAAVIILVVFAIGRQVNTAFEDVSEGLTEGGIEDPEG